MKTKSFNTIDGGQILVTIFVKRITLEYKDIKAEYSCYDISLIPKLHDKILSEGCLGAINQWINENCIYLQPDKPKEIKPKEGEQFSLF